MKLFTAQVQSRTPSAIAGRERRGFSMVELLLVIALVGIIATLLFQGFSQYVYRQVFEQFSSEIKNELVEARAQTISSLGDTTYGVYVGPDTIEFFPGTVPTPGSTDNTIVQIPTQLTATSSFSSGEPYVSFKRITGAATATGTITIVDTRTVATSTFTISAVGLVE